MLAKKSPRPRSRRSSSLKGATPSTTNSTPMTLLTSINATPTNLFNSISAESITEDNGEGELFVGYKQEGENEVKEEGENVNIRAAVVHMMGDMV